MASLLILASAAVAQDDAPRFEPVSVSPGPLLFFVNDGRLYLHDPESGREPFAVASGRVGHPRPVGRVARNLVLVCHDSRVFLLDLDRGSSSSLGPNDDKTSVALIESGRVYFLRHEKWVPLRGYYGETTEDGTEITRYFEPRDFLYVFDSTRPEKPRLLTDTPIATVLSIDRESFWVVTADEPRHLCRVMKAGGIEQVVPIDDHWVTLEIEVSFSPDREFLALTAMHELHDFHDDRSVAVIDLPGKEVIHAADRVKEPGFLQPDGNLLHIALEWIDDQTLAYDWFNPRFNGPFSKTVVVRCDVRSVLTGNAAAKFVHEHPSAAAAEDAATAAAVALQPGSRNRHGSFERSHGQLFFPGEPEPIICQVSDLEVCPEGRWAVAVPVPAMREAGWTTVIVDGTVKTSRILIPGRSSSLVWLPSTMKPAAQTK